MQTDHHAGDAAPDLVEEVACVLAVADQLDTDDEEEIRRNAALWRTDRPEKSGWRDEHGVPRFVPGRDHYRMLAELAVRRVEAARPGWRSGLWPLVRDMLPGAIVFGLICLARMW